MQISRLLPVLIALRAFWTVQGYSGESHFNDIASIEKSGFSFVLSFLFVCLILFSFFFLSFFNVCVCVCECVCVCARACACVSAWMRLQRDVCGVCVCVRACVRACVRTLTITCSKILVGFNLYSTLQSCVQNCSMHNVVIHYIACIVLFCFVMYWSPCHWNTVLFF